MKNFEDRYIMKYYIYTDFSFWDAKIHFVDEIVIQKYYFKYITNG